MSNHNSSTRRTVICSEDGNFESYTRHPLKCDRNPQLPPVTIEPFSYTRFSQYVQANFLIQAQQRKADMCNGKPPPSLEHFTDDVFKQELFDIYGNMDETSEKFRLIFNNYKEERVEQIQKWIKDEKSNNISANEVEVCDIQDIFSSKELLDFESVSKGKLDPFILPRVILNDEDILGRYVDYDEKRKLDNLTEFDPEIHINRFTIPEICDMNVGEKLAEKIVEIIRNHPTGITNTNFLIEFKKKTKYFPEPKNMNYSSFGEMMKDLGKHTIFIQYFKERLDNFYYPMCLQGLVSKPKNMFWNIWHKIKIVLHIHQGIVKVSKAILLCEEIFGWGKLDIKSWGFETIDLFIKFLIAQSSDQEIELVPESDFRPKGNPNVNYLVLMTEKRRKYLETRSLKIQVRPPPLPFESSSLYQSSQSKSSYRQQLIRPQQCQPQSEKSEIRSSQPPPSQPPSQNKGGRRRAYRLLSPSQFTSPQTVVPLLPPTPYQQQTPRPLHYSDSILRVTEDRRPRAPNPPKPRTWSSLLK